MPLRFSNVFNSRHLVWITITLLAIAFLLWLGGVPNIFGLSGSNTVYEYHTASISARVDFLSSLCRNGACITYADWKCGFSLESTSKTEDCFKVIVDQVKPWVRLDAVRKYCGQKNMEFVNTLYSTPDDCLKTGWKWGVPAPIAKVE